MLPLYFEVSIACAARIIWAKACAVLVTVGAFRKCTCAIGLGAVVEAMPVTVETSTPSHLQIFW